ncbi:hypothetical protein D3C76_1536760 [compost metagenome]
MLAISINLGGYLAEIAGPVEKGSLALRVITTQTVGWIGRYLDQPPDRFYW